MAGTAFGARTRDKVGFALKPGFCEVECVERIV